MGGIFGFALLKNNKMTKSSLGLIVTELLRGQLDQVDTVGIVATSCSKIDVFKRDFNVSRVLASEQYHKFLEEVIDAENLRSVICGCGKSDFSKKKTGYNKTPISMLNNVISVQKENNNCNNIGGEVLVEILEKHEYKEGVLSRIKNVVRNVDMYASVNAYYPDTLLIAKHNFDPLFVSTFDNYGIIIFSSSRTGLDNVVSRILLGKETNVDMFANQAILMHLANNTHKVINILLETI